MTRARVTYDQFGRTQYEEVDTSQMMSPVKCLRCREIHDSSRDVEIVARYADCTVWKCPHCQAPIDDRPIGWGGSAERVERSQPARRLRRRWDLPRS